MPLLEVRNLSVSFPTPQGEAHAVSGVNWTVEPGSAVGLVGESGSGKSVLNLAILGLIGPPARVTADAIHFNGEDLRSLPERRLRQMRGNQMAMIFQDPMTSLNPFLTVGDQLCEPLRLHKRLGRRAARQRAIELMREVGIEDADKRLDAYPHHFSGGMRQRVMIAMSIACHPSLLVADEPTTALDVTIQAQVIELLQRIRRDHQVSVVLITHDLGVAAGFCESIHVMYGGRLVESAPTRRLYARPAHPYTTALLDAVPRLDVETTGDFTSIGGSPPDPARLPAGCAFAPRCPRAQDICRNQRPALAPIPNEPERQVACFVDLITQPTAPTTLAPSEA